MTVISIAGAQAKHAVREMLAIQERIDINARLLLSGRKAAEKLEDLLNELERTIDRLRGIAARVTDDDLRTAALTVCNRYSTWNQAKLGTQEERDAAAAYLSCLDELRRLAR